MKKVVIIVLSSIFCFGCSFGEGYLGSTIPMDGLAAWYAADGKIDKSGVGEVFAWPDISGNGYDLVTTPPGPPYPAWINGAVNGKPVILFDDTNGYLKNTSGPNLTNNNITIFIVMQGNNSIGGVLSSPPDFSIIQQGGAPPFNVDLFHAAPPSIPVIGLVEQFSYKVYTFRYSGSEVKVYKNGANAVGSPFSSVNPFNFVAGIIIGDNNTESDQCNAYIAEVIIYSTNLDDNAREYVEDYLIEKYGL